ncbi:MAG: methyltransferase [Oscillospiraceae bacterium]|nr:methyltransferase [Oscillospiraceae bacterium]
MNSFEQLWPGGPVFCQAAHFRLGTDCVLLADFVNTAGARRGIDLGCASGAAMLLLLSRTERLHMTGVELLPEAAECARENLAANALGTRGEVVTGDIREHRKLFRAGSFDLVVANPPYYPVGSGTLPANAERALARGELTCTLEELCTAAAFLCRTGGSACLVHKPERLSELLCCLTGCGLEPKRLRLVCPRPESAPSLVLVEARRGGRPGLRIEPPLLLQDADGNESAEVKRIYHR